MKNNSTVWNTEESAMKVLAPFKASLIQQENSKGLPYYVFDGGDVTMNSRSFAINVLPSDGKAETIAQSMGGQYVDKRNQGYKHSDVVFFYYSKGDYMSVCDAVRRYLGAFLRSDEKRNADTKNAAKNTVESVKTA